MSKVTKNERIAQLEQIAVDQAKAFKEMADRLNYLEVESKRIIRMTGIEKPQLKQLDQSVFEGRDSNWQWAAIDEDGAAYIFHEAPEKTERFWTNANQTRFDRVYVEGTCDTSNWQNSLIERKAELTGSDLCRAMLARGDKCVMCYLSGTSEDSARDVKGIVIGYDHAGFRVLRNNSWCHAVPINNQGEPLTAKDVGL